MAVAVVQSVTAVASTKVRSISSPSITVTAGNLVYVALSTASTTVVGDGAITGLGLTYTKMYEQGNPPSQLCLWRATVGSNATDTVDVDWANNSQAAIAVVEVSGGTHNQSVINTGSGSPASISLITDFDYSMILAILAKAGNEAITPDGDYTEVLENASTGGFIYERETIHSQRRELTPAGSDTVSASGTWGSTSKYWVIAAVEINPTTLTAVAGVGALTLAGYAPTITHTAPPAVGSLTLALLVPTLDLSANVTVEPVLLALTLTGYEAYLSPSIVPALALAMTLPAPALGDVSVVNVIARARDLNLVAAHKDLDLRAKRRDLAFIVEKQ